MIQNQYTLCLISGEQTRFVDIHGLTAIGGSQSSGIVLEELKYKDDYFIASPSAEGISLHPLRGRKKTGNIQLRVNSHYSLLDLTILVLPLQQQKDSVGSDEEKNNRFAEDVRVLVQRFSQPSDLKGAMGLLLETMLATYEMDKGLVIASNSKGEFKLMAEENISQTEPWLSETLVQQTIRQNKPTIIQNIIGSKFEASHSLMATGFMSACVWPLNVRGEVLGVLIIGSNRPHSGLSEKQLHTAEAYVQLAALMLKFYINDIHLKREVAMLREASLQSDCPLTTSDSGLGQTIQLAQQVACTNLSVLIQGETGVGKEVMAQWIHKTSDRSNGPFVPVNCSAIPSDLLESLLFGHRKGAFTGAVKDQKGKFELAHGGTLFLDEIGDLPSHLQAKILRALQERVIEPLGTEKSINIDVRILSATHLGLQNMVEKGSFREDLFYRLAEVSLEIPSLRERSDDVISIAHHVLRELNSEKRFLPEAMNWLQNQEWKGNVRELKSAVRRGAALCPGEFIGINHLVLGGPQSNLKQKQDGWLGGDNLEEAKNRFVMEKVRIALNRSNNNKTKAAESLGVTPRTLFRYLENSDEV